MKAAFALIAIGALALALGSGSALALNPSLDVNQYGHTVWVPGQGSSLGRIYAIAQTPDGYLWLGTEFGLYRFDGVRAVSWAPPAGSQLSDTYIRSLVAARDGTLWIGTYGGLASWKDGKLTRYPELAGQEVGALVEDHEGTIWAGTGYQTVVGKLCAIRRNSVQCEAGGRFGNAVYSLYEDTRGNLWVGAVNGLWRWKPGPPRFYPMADRMLSLGEGEDGALLALTRGGIKQVVQGRMLPFPLRGGGLLELLFRDRDGSLWIGMQYGLLHVHQGNTDVFTKSDGLSGDVISAIFEDHEGNIWVGTDNGLDHFREPAVVPLTPLQGFSDVNRTAAVLAAEDGSVWISNFDRLTRWKSGKITTYSRARRGPTEDPAGLAKRAPVHEIIDTALADEIIGSLFEDQRRRIWASTIPRVVYFENDRFLPLDNTAGCKFVHSFAEDTTGDIWISAHEFLCHMHQGSLIEQIPWTGIRIDDFAETVVGDPVRGGLWLGFFKGGVKYIRDGKVQASYGTANGLGSGRVNSLRLDRDGTVWAATTGGLSRIQNGRVSTLTRKNGLPCDNLDWSIEDDAGSLWLNMACGLVRITRAELDSWLENSSSAVQNTVFDSADGVKSHAFYISTTPHVAKSSDGRIWFSHWDGLSVFDPRHLPANEVPPPVHIEQITADGKVYDGPQRLRLPPLVRDLTINYTALSFVAPEKVRFRFKLDGQDKTWREVVNERRVQYSNLGPGTYRFRVIASNNSGLWNEQGDTLEFSVAPAYWQTNWFRAIWVALSLALLFAAYWLRMRKVRQELTIRLEAKITERTRIARDLHDTLLQGFHGLLFRFQAARNMLPNNPVEASEALDGAIIRAEQALQEGRKSIQELRSGLYGDGDLDQMSMAIGQELLSLHSPERSPNFGIIVEGERRRLCPGVNEEVIQIERELLLNAFQHARARAIEAEIRYERDTFRLVVRDDGKGIDPKILKDGGRPGHWGMPGVRERARDIGAHLEFWSEAGAGTEVRLTLPAAVAYEKPENGTRSRVFRKWRNNERSS